MKHKNWVAKVKIRSVFHKGKKVDLGLPSHFWGFPPDFLESSTIWVKSDSRLSLNDAVIAAIDAFTYDIVDDPEINTETTFWVYASLDYKSLRVGGSIFEVRFEDTGRFGDTGWRARRKGTTWFKPAQNLKLDVYLNNSEWLKGRDALGRALKKKERLPIDLKNTKLSTKDLQAISAYYGGWDAFQYGGRSDVDFWDYGLVAKHFGTDVATWWQPRWSGYDKKNDRFWHDVAWYDGKTGSFREMFLGFKINREGKAYASVVRSTQPKDVVTLFRE